MRLVHLSDLHLGFRAYFQIERGWNRRERDLAAAFRWALQETVRLKPDVVLVTGDVFDNPNPPSTAFLTIHRGVSHLRARLPDVPILIIAGEHDSPRIPADPGPVAVLDSLAGVEAAAGAPRAVRLRRKGLHALLIPFRAAAQPPFPEVRPDPSARWNVLLIRADPSGSGEGIEVDPGDWSYVAVGGHHQATEWAANVHTAGALERPGPCPWREATEERGFLSFDLEQRTPDFHPVPGRPVVDLAPVRVAPGDLEPGTRRLRELLQGVPGGVEGKIVRARLRGDVVTPGEGVSQGLLDAVRRRAAHLEVHVEPRETALAAVTHQSWAATEIRAPGLNGLSFGADRPLPSITLVTSESDSIRAQIVEALRQGSSAVPPLHDLKILPGPPEDPVLAGLWSGGWDLSLLIRVVLGGLHDHVRESERPAKADGGRLPEEAEAVQEILAPLEAELTRCRGDWVESTGDLEAGNLQWAQERQEADSKLQAYRDRATELRVRMRALEAEKGNATCPTCGRALGDGFSDLLETLRGEWENLVQDGRWWKRRRDQLDQKPEELQKLEEHALRLQVRVEEAAETLERHRERVRELDSELAGSSESVGNARAFRSSRLDEIGDPDLRQVLRLAGSLMARITEGRVVGVSVDQGVRVVSAEGSHRDPVGAERDALRLAVHLGLWLHSRSKTKQTQSLFVWQLHETAVEELFRGALDVLSDTERFPVPILLVAPPTVLEHVPGAFSQALELTACDQGRYEFRHSRHTRPILDLPA